MENNCMNSEEQPIPLNQIIIMNNDENSFRYNGRGNVFISTVCGMYNNH